MKRSASVDLDAIVSEEHRIPSDEPGVELHVRSRRPRSMSTFRSETTIVMVHGATYSSGSLYDVRLGGYSFLDYLASVGFEAFAVDVRGYGLSTRPAEMEADPDAHPPVVDTASGVKDLAAAVAFVLALRSLDQANVFAMSWGGTVAGAFTAANPAPVRRLALLAPQWLSDRPIPLDPGGPLGSYRLVPVLDTMARWLGAAPDGARGALIPQGWFEQWGAATLAEDPWSADRTPGRLRATNGPVEDIRRYWRAGRPYYDPSRITAPVLLVHGEWDLDVPIDLALAFFGQLRSARYRRWVEIGEATHMVLLERNRLQAFRAIGDFFGEDDPSPS